MSFYTTVYLPVSKIHAQVREMHMSQYSTLQKYLLENDDSNTAAYLATLAKECSLYALPDLCNVDMFFLLCKIRNISLGDELNFVINDVNIKCSLEQTTERLLQLDYNFKRGIQYNNIDIQFNLPHLLNISAYADVLEDVITHVCDVPMHIQPAEIRLKVLQSLPGNILDQSIHYIKSNFELMQQYWFLPPREEVQLPGIGFNAFNNSLLEILKFIFRDDLMNVYNIKYILASKLHITPAQADAMSPVECRIYISLLNDEISKQNKQLQDQSNASKYML